MNFVWLQDSGSMMGTDGKLIQQLYAGRGTGQNNPLAQSEHNAGPLPVGGYTIGPTEATHVTAEGHVLTDSAALIPDPENEMYGRSGFRLHGRKSLEDSACKRLQVLSGISG